MKLRNTLIGLLFTLIPFFANAQSRPVVLDINVIPKEKSQIKISWHTPENTNPAITGYLICRDTKQITSYEQLSSLGVIAELASDVNEYIDMVEDFKEYFYSVIATTENGPYIIILPSMNTSISGVRARKNTSTENQVIVPKQNSTSKKSDKPVDMSEKMRSIPLPTPGLVDMDKKPAVVLGDKAMSASKTLGKNYLNKKNKITKMHVFEEDLICPEGGDDYYLFKILKTYFVKKDFAGSIKELNDFLSVRRSPSSAKRATFYLGESYYFLKDYQNSLFNFLTVSDDWPELSKKWIDSSLDMIELNTTK
ncbi:MAG: hypothetical protein IK002_03180 [Treponema sp.]|uniref:tetratricopeptide repeat protein n=1 Tax=Treponema sp. TaxID=166 RepID=UPI00298EA294|nr:hypothetical protein [Treponema sp.]MBR5932969.1 hypothetical protein [Treponema sp.]